VAEVAKATKAVNATTSAGRRCDWQKLESLFEQASALSGEQRARLLDARCGDDRQLRAELSGMLRASAPGRALAIERLAPDAHPEPDAPAPDPLLGATLGSWRLGPVLGRGGMGTVYLAERADGQYRQRAALKLVHAGLVRPETVERFRTERQVLAHLQHPNIARLIDGGFTGDGRPYFVMELVEGAPITDACRARQLPLPDRLRLFRRVCDAVEHAHAARVVHRDLKPANILVSLAGEVKLLDFGIAKLLEPTALGVQAPATRADVTLLTPEYAAPEQLTGRPITTATDVYALGVVLHELLTGTRPAPQAGKPLAPPGSRLGRRQRRDLDGIVRTALQADSGLRYVTAGRLGEDITRFLADRPVRARPETLPDRARRFLSCNRRPAAAALATAIALGSLGALAGGARDRDSGPDRLLLGSELHEETLALAADGRLVEAEQSLRQAFAQRVRLLGESHAKTALAARGLGELLARQRRYAEALAWFDRALASPEGGRPRAHRLARGQRALALLRLGHSDEAVADLRASEREMVRARMPDGPRGALSLVRLWLARALTESGRPAEAEEPARQALAVLVQLSPRDPQRAEAACELGRALVLSGRPEAGRALLEAALPIYGAWVRADPALVAAAQRLLASARTGHTPPPLTRRLQP
jgi:tetratricopeptide (TPR) repeat protein